MEQFTRFNADPYTDMELNVSITFEEKEEEDRFDKDDRIVFCKSNDESAATPTECVSCDEAPSESTPNTNKPSFPLGCSPLGSVVITSVSSDCEPTVCDALFAGSKKPNWKVSGRSASLICDTERENCVETSTPVDGCTKNFPPDGAALVEKDREAVLSPHDKRSV